MIVKASGSGVLDEELEAAIPMTRSGPSTPHMSYGSGEPVVEAYQEVGAQTCVPIYSALVSLWSGTKQKSRWFGWNSRKKAPEQWNTGWTANAGTIL